MNKRKQIMSKKSSGGKIPIDDEGNRNSGADAIYEQREWLRVTLESIGDAVITTGTDGKITFLNSVAQQLTGWSQAEATGIALDLVFRIVNEDTRLPVENPADRAFREGVVVGLANHTLLIAKDGTERPIDDSAAPIRNASGEVAGVVLVFRDISERRRQELEIKDSLAFSQNIIATLREPFLVLDKNLIVKTANSAFYHTFHVTKEQTEERFVFDLGEGEWNIPRLRILLDEVLADHHPVENFEVEHHFKLLGSRTMMLNASRFTSVDSGPDLILLAIEDVTERKRAEARLRDSEIKYRRLFQTAKDGILILDADSGEIIDSNPFMSGLLGYEHDEFLGKELWEIGLFQDVKANRAAYEELKQNGYIRYDHLPLQSKSGRKSEVEFVSNIYHMDHHEVVQCNIRDITERSRLERETREQAAALADQHRRKDEFLAMLSHELRNPLSPILNAVHLLRLQKEENLIQKEARGIIERQVGQLSRLVDDLLEVSRITTGRVRLHLERIDMRIIVERAVESVRPLIDRRRHELIITSPDDPIWLHADPTRMEQVVVNILNNAAKYTDEGGTIWLSVDQEENEMLLRVRDTGVGIASELLPLVFDLFTQARRSLDRSQGGLGIGLSLVKHLVEMHRGKVEAHSEGIGRGSEFIVRMPVLQNASIRSEPHSAKHDDHATTGLRVLVVDDNVDSTDILAKLLRLSGHNVRTAYAGSSALDVAASHLPDVVLLDIGLPGINGYEVARRLRLLPRLKDVKIVAMTGYGQDSDRRLAQESGFDDHMTKPVDFVKVLSLLSSYFDNSG
jgi:PAS domain S-box-containing protein